MITSLFLSLVMFGAADSTDCAPPLSWVKVSNKTTVSNVCTCECECCDGGKCSTKHKEPSATAPEIPSTGVGTVKKLDAPVPTVHSLADKYGQVWTHSDKAYLERFIQQRNYVAPVQTYFYPAGGMSSCATGNCPR